MPALAGVTPRRTRGGRTVPILLAITFLFAAALRWNNLDWDQGHFFHPDERAILMVTAGLSLPWPLNWPLLVSPSSPLNPHMFAYGSLPFYLLKLIGQGLASLGGWLPFAASLQPFGDIDHLRLVGRFLSGLFDLGTVALVYYIGRQLWDRWVGLLAAAFLAVTVLHVQYSHFYASDTMVSFFVMLTALFNLRVLKYGSRRDSILAGVALGLALGSKFSAAPVAAVLVGAHLLRMFGEEQTSTTGNRLRLRLPSTIELHSGALMLGASLASAVLVFLIIEPYALIDFTTFAKNLGEQNAMVRGIADLPYTRQYAGTTPYWYFVTNLAVWEMGLPMGLAVLGGAVAGIVRALRQPRSSELVLLLWLLPYFAITGSFHAKFLRYMLPLTPFLCLFAAAALLSAWQHSRDRSRAREGADGEVGPLALDTLPRWRRLATRKWLAGIGIAGGLIGGVLYALAFGNVYGVEHTAIRGSEWIYQHVPPGSRLLTEHWEEGMPVPLTMGGERYDGGRMGYKPLTFEGYEADNPAKVTHIVQRLAEADYIVFFSNRLYDTIPRLPKRYPVTARYYELLFGEQLGFQLEAYFTSYPSLLGVTLVEDTFGDPRLPVPTALAHFQPTPMTIVGGKPDESFSVYDHPKVLIFRKVEPLSEDALRALFEPALGQSASGSNVTGSTPDAKSLLLNEAQRATVAAGGTYRDLFDPAGITNRWPVPTWMALLLVLGLLGLPLAFTLFRNLTDRGQLLARPLAILALTWIDWMLVSVGWLQNTRGTAVLALVIVAIASGFFAWRGWPALRAHWREQRRLILLEEGLFWASFGLFLAIRVANPDLWHPARGGEKPMDIAYLMAAIKSAAFPPYDPWFAGGYLNYYYYGQIIVGTLIKLVAIVPTVAYNLVVPTLFALTAGGAFSAGYNLLSRARSAGSFKKVAVLGGMLSAAAAVLLGNIGGPLQLGEQIMRLGPAPLHSRLPGIEGAGGLLAGLWRMFGEGRGLTIATDWYWASTRILQGTINEFPFFTFLYADLHAHMIALPFTMVALGLAIDVVKGAVGMPVRTASLVAQTQQIVVREYLVPGDGATAPSEGVAPAENMGEAKDQLVARERARLRARFPGGVLRLLAAGLIIGALLPINSWDFPTYLVLYVVGLLAAWFATGKARRTALAGATAAGPSSLPAIALQALAVAGLSYLLYWPFHAQFQQWYLGVDLIKDKSEVGGYLRIHALFLFAIVSFLLVETVHRYGRSGLPRLLGIWLRRWESTPRLIALHRRLVKRDEAQGHLAAYGIAIVVALLLGVHLMGMTLVAVLLGLLIWTVLLALHRDNTPERLFVLALVAAGLALSVAVEMVAIKGDIGRMNTVFKFYLQVWMLWSVALGTCVYGAWGGIVRWWPRRLRLWSGLLALLVFAALVYPFFATLARVHDRFDNSVPPTLDGTAYMDRAVFREENPDTKQAAEISLGSDLPAMHWLQENVQGTPVILEGWAPLYHWGARYSIYTGLPTVIGWDWHEKQQRWGYQAEIDRRVADVRSIYSDPSAERADALLAKYGVQYVIVGGLERAVYPATGLAKFDQMMRRYVTLVYEGHGVKIFRRM